jgi:hypothetical protein
MDEGIVAFFLFLFWFLEDYHAPMQDIDKRFGWIN